MCEKDAKELEKIYHDLAQQLRKLRAEETTKALAKVAAKLRARFPSESECWANFSIRQFSKDNLVKMMLRQIEINENPGEKTLKGDKVVWLEHVLPKKPKTGSAWVEIFDSEIERTEYTYRIGNYALLLDRLNEAARNKPFSEKKEYYAKSQIRLTQQLSRYGKWDASVIGERTGRLFKLVKKVWPVYSE